MKKRLVTRLLSIILVFGLGRSELAVAGLAESEAAAEVKALFSQPPPASRPWCYWYWVAGNISREGIVADLDDFKRVGIGGLYLMDIHSDPAGSVSYRSPLTRPRAESGFPISGAMHLTDALR
jgi:hypothetical protein